MEESRSDGYGGAIELSSILDRRSYEEACVLAVRKAFSPEPEAGFATHLAETGRSLKRVHLEGTYPATRLIVTMNDERYGHERAFAYDLWGDAAAGFAPPGHQPAPDLMATNIVTWTMEE